jgi:hypothetical protein
MLKTHIILNNIILSLFFSLIKTPLKNIAKAGKIGAMIAQ